MTHDERKVAILRERAKRLAERVDVVAPRKLRVRVVLVAAGRESYGLPISNVREIVHASPVASLPGMPPFVQGIAGVRGELLSVVDLAELHGRGKTGNAAYFAVLESKRGAVAMRVESVLGFRDVYDDEIAEALTQHDIEDARNDVVTKDFVSIVDVEGLFAGERLVVGTRDPKTARGRVS